MSTRARRRVLRSHSPVSSNSSENALRSRGRGLRTRSRVRRGGRSQGARGTGSSDRSEREAAAPGRHRGGSRRGRGIPNARSRGRRGASTRKRVLRSQQNPVQRSAHNLVRIDHNLRVRENIRQHNPPAPRVSPENSQKKRAVNSPVVEGEFISNAIEFEFLYTKENLFKWKGPTRNPDLLSNPDRVIQAFKQRGFDLVIIDKENGVIFTNRKRLDTGEFVESSPVSCLGFEFSTEKNRRNNVPILISEQDFKHAIHASWCMAFEASTFRKMGPIWAMEGQDGNTKIQIGERKFLRFTGLRLRVEVKEKDDTTCGLIYLVPTDLTFYGDCIRDMLMKGDYELRPPEGDDSLHEIFNEMEKKFQPPYSEEKEKEFHEFEKRILGNGLQSDEVKMLLKKKKTNITSYRKKLLGSLFRDGPALVGSSMKVVNVIRVTEVKTTAEMYVGRPFVLKLTGATCVECDDGTHPSDELYFKARLSMNEQSMLALKVKEMRFDKRHNFQTTDSLDSQRQCLHMLQGIIQRDTHLGLGPAGTRDLEFHFVHPHWAAEFGIQRAETNWDDLAISAQHMWNKFAVAKPDNWPQKMPEFKFVIHEEIDSRDIYKFKKELLEVQKKREYLPIGWKLEEIENKCIFLDVFKWANESKFLVDGMGNRNLYRKLKEVDLIFVLMPPTSIQESHRERYVTERIQLSVQHKKGINPRAAVQCFCIDSLEKPGSLLSAFDVGVVTKLGSFLFSILPTQKAIKNDFDAVLTLDVRNCQKARVISAVLSREPLIATIRNPEIHAVVVVDSKASKVTISNGVLKRLWKELKMDDFNGKNVVIYRNCLEESEQFEEEIAFLSTVGARVVFVKCAKACSLRLYTSGKDLLRTTVITDPKFGEDKFFIKLPSQGKERERIETYPTMYQVRNLSWARDDFEMENIIYFTRAQTKMYVYCKAPMRVPGLLQYGFKNAMKVCRLLQMFEKRQIEFSEQSLQPTVKYINPDAMKHKRETRRRRR